MSHIHTSVSVGNSAFGLGEDRGGASLAWRLGIEDDGCCKVFEPLLLGSAVKKRNRNAGHTRDRKKNAHGWRAGGGRARIASGR
jgi:hypothetical protein